MSTPAWPAEWCDRLRQLWGEGHSTAQIGRTLGVSKNAVVGKAHRLHLPRRPSPIKRGIATPPHRSSIPAVGAQTLALLASLKPEIVVARKAPPPPPPKAPEPPPVPRKWTPYKTCQWPVSAGRPWRFCDAPVDADHGTYCAKHAKMARGKAADIPELAA